MRHSLFITICYVSLVTSLPRDNNYCKPTRNENVLVPDGDFVLNLLIPSCYENNSSTKLFEKPTETYVETAIWVVDRLNSLNFTHPYVLGLKSHEVCNENDYERVVFDVYNLEEERNGSLGIISMGEMSKKIEEFGKLLNVTVEKIKKEWIYLVRAAVKVVENLEWNEPITVVTEDQDLMNEFNQLTRRAWMCVDNSIIWNENDEVLEANDKVDLVVFGTSDFLTKVLDFKKNNFKRLLLVLIDGSKIKEFPENALVIQESHVEEKPSSYKVPSTSLLLDVAKVIINLVQSHNGNYCKNNNIIIAKNNNTLCSNIVQKKPSEIIETLKLENAKEMFNYDVYQKIENNGSTLSETIKMFSYNILEDNFIFIENNMSISNTSKNVTMCSDALGECLRTCANFRDKVVQKTALGSRLFSDVVLRSESWLFGFVSIAVLGVIFAISTLIFFIVTMIKRIIFEGNPSTTILLIIAIIGIYCSIIPFTLTGGKESGYLICLYRALSVSLSYAAAFSLLLSRSIVLATISKELGYMSHASGPVQSFLCFFMFAVQCALCLQYIHKCKNLFDDLLFLYSLSYNMVLLVLFLCVSPLIFHSQRNYREGKYFAMSAICMTIAWICWILGYVFLGPKWKDSMVCLGLVSTGSIMVAIILIPRTYMMTVAATRNKITNALPTLRTSSSIMDIYKATAQPIYDCVNVTAINNSTTGQDTLMKNSADEKYYQNPENNFEVDTSTPTTVQAEKTTRF